MRGARLDLTDVEPTQGSEPNAVAQHKNLVYVLNSAGTNSVVGFRFFAGRLFRIPDSRAFLTGAGVGSASLAFSPDGKFLLATERTTNVIDVFSVLAGGKVAALTTTPSVGAGAFSALFAPNGTAIVSQTAGSATGSSISSYAVQPDRTLVPISANVPTLGVANCWNAITPDGRFVYVSNTGSSSIAGFAVGADGGLTALPGTVVGQNPAGSGNLDIAISSDGDFLYSLNSAGGTLGVFAIDGATGALENLGTVGGLPASVGMNGIAAR